MTRRLLHTADPDLGHCRIVRSAKRARLLRKRGVVLYRVDYLGLRFWRWYESDWSFDVRAKAKRLHSLLQARIRKAKREHGLNWVHGLLESTFYQTHTRYTLHAPESPNGLTYDMTSPDVHVDCDCMACRPWTT